MKILYFGTVCDLKNYESMLSGSKEKTSVATVLFESSLLAGFAENEVEIEVYSYPMIPVYPRSKHFLWGNKKEKLACGYLCTWLRTINIPFIKQLSRRINGRQVLKKWLKKNHGDDCVILSYSMPPFLTKDIINFSKKYNVKCFTVLADLLRDMYINSHDNKFVSLLKKRYLAQALQLQGSFDGYIYLTEAMSDVVNPDKPYIVMEGIANTDNPDINNVQKTYPRAIMYAGMLEEKFGIFNLLDAFESANLDNAQLWLFGSGNAVDEILKRAKKNPNIIFFGRKEHDVVLEYERKATVLVNPRSTEDEYTRYSFPSKTIEYMLSGTPVLTTRLEGIPKEYFNYVFSCADNSPAELEKALVKAMTTPDDKKAEIGYKAKEFIINNKNARTQTARIIEFISEVTKS